MKPENLKKHPEGGRFCEVYRSVSKVTNESKNIRTALTHIYFSLNPGEVSKFHKVKSDEVWNLYEGTNLFLYTWDGKSEIMDCVELSKKKREYCYAVPAGMWQAAISKIDKVIVGCSVAPGFEFDDFELMKKNGNEAQILKSKFPELLHLIIS